MPFTAASIARWESGRAEEGVALVDQAGAVCRVAVFGPAPGYRALHPDLASAARRHLPKALGVDSPMRVTQGHLQKLVESADRSIRGDLTVMGEGTRATLVYATFRNGRLHTAHTGGGSVVLLRDGEVVAIAGETGVGVPPLAGSSKGVQARTHTMHELPWIGARRRGDVPGVRVAVDCVDAAQRLQPGDRVVLCSAPLGELEAIQPLAEALSFGTPDVAAQSLHDLLELRRGLEDVAVAVVDWPHPDAPRREPAAAVALLDDAMMGDLAAALGSLSEQMGDGESTARALAARGIVADDEASDLFWEEDAELFSAVAHALDQLATDFGDGDEVGQA